MAIAQADVAFALEHVHDLPCVRMPMLRVGLPGKNVHQPEALLAIGVEIAIGDPLDRSPVVDNWFNVPSFSDRTFQHGQLLASLVTVHQLSAWGGRAQSRRKDQRGQYEGTRGSSGECQLKRGHVTGIATATSKIASQPVKSSLPPLGGALRSEHERGGNEARDGSAKKRPAPARPLSFAIDGRELRLLLATQEDPDSAQRYRYLAACLAHMGRFDDAREIVARLRAIIPVEIPDASYIPLRNPEHRELLLSGLRLAAAEI
jgi:hypothetical protein